MQKLTKIRVMDKVLTLCDGLAHHELSINAVYELTVSAISAAVSRVALVCPAEADKADRRAGSMHA